MSRTVRGGDGQDVASSTVQNLSVAPLRRSLAAAVGEGRLAGLWAGAPDPSIELLLCGLGIAAVGDDSVGRELAAHAHGFAAFAARAATHLDRMIVSTTLAIGAGSDAIAKAPREAAELLAAVAWGLARHPDPAVRLPALRARGGLLRALPSLRDRLEADLVAPPDSSRRRRAITSLAAAPSPMAEWVAGRLSSVLFDDGEASRPVDRASFGPALGVIDLEGPVAALVWRALDDGVFTTADEWWSMVDGLRVVRLASEGSRPRVDAALRTLAECARAGTAGNNRGAIRRCHEIGWMLARCGLDGAPTSPDDYLGRAEDLVFAALHEDPRAVAPRAVALARAVTSLLRDPLHGQTVRAKIPVGDDLDLPVEVAYAQARLNGAGRIAALRPWEPVLAAAGCSTSTLDELASSAQDALEQGARGLVLSPSVHATWKQTGVLLVGAWLDGSRSGRKIELGPSPEEVLDVLRFGLLEQPKLDSLLQKPVGEVVARILAPASSAGDTAMLARFAGWAALRSGSPSFLGAVVNRFDHGLPVSDRDAWLKRLRPRLAAAHAAASGDVATIASAAFAETLAGAWDALVGAPDPTFRLTVVVLGRVARALVGGDALPAAQTRQLLGDLALTLARIEQHACGLLPGPGAAFVVACAPSPGTDRTAPTVSGTSPPPTAATLASIGALHDQEPAPLATSAAAGLPPAALALVDATMSAFGSDHARIEEVRLRWRLHAGPLFAGLASTLVDTIGGRIVAEAAPSRRVGRYDLTAPISRGGMGELWTARRADSDLGDAGQVAVKLPLANAFGDAGDPERLERLRASVRGEAIALLRLQHPNVVRCVDVGLDREQPFLVMELLRGMSLDAYAAIRLLRPYELAPIVRDTCRGLGALHAAGIVHRDVKPGNLFLCMDLREAEDRSSPRCRDPLLEPILCTTLVDLGLAVSDLASQPVGGGTVGYLAPEQAGNQRVGPPTDVYAVAATVYRVTTGRSLFDTCGNQRVFHHAAVAPFAPGTLPGDEHLRAARRALPERVVRLLADATTLRPDERPDAASFTRQLDALVG